jgi:hypothetical protein
MDTNNKTKGDSFVRLEKYRNKINKECSVWVKGIRIGNIGVLKMDYDRFADEWCEELMFRCEIERD